MEIINITKKALVLDAEEIEKEKACMNGLLLNTHGDKWKELHKYAKYMIVKLEEIKQCQ